MDKLNKKNNIKIWLKALCCICITLSLTVLFSGCTKDTTANLSEKDIAINEFDLSTFDIEEDIKVISIANTEMTTVNFTSEDIGRSDPFLPSSNSYRRPIGSGYDIMMPPPETITVDTEATEVISTKVSGIMYDNMNPSAIINIAGSDYLVRTGDIINGYKILSIAKNYVAVQYGTNIYKAGVGELFNENEITHNTVSNLENKFGGNKY